MKQIIKILHKLETISDCGQCPNYHVEDETTVSICNKTKRILDTLIIPGWCPLPDYQEQSPEVVSREIRHTTPTPKTLPIIKGGLMTKDDLRHNILNKHLNESGQYFPPTLGRFINEAMQEYAEEYNRMVCALQFVLNKEKDQSPPPEAVLFGEWIRVNNYFPIYSDYIIGGWKINGLEGDGEFKTTQELYQEFKH